MTLSALPTPPESGEGIERRPLVTASAISFHTNASARPTSELPGPTEARIVLLEDACRWLRDNADVTPLSLAFDSSWPADGLDGREALVLTYEEG